MNTSHSQTTQGFTLFGLLLYISLTAVVLTALGELTIGVLRLSTRADYDRSSIYALSFIQAKIGYDIGRADSIVAPTPEYPSASLSLLYEGDTITYYVAEERLWVQTSFSDPEALTPEDVVVSTSTFTAISTPLNKNPIRMDIETGIHDPLRPDILIQHPPTVLTWYPYAYD